FSLYKTAFRRVRHELWIILEVIDNCAHCGTWRVDKADCLELFQVRLSVWPAVNDHVFSVSRQFPTLFRAYRTGEVGCKCVRTGNKQDQTEAGENSAKHRAMIHGLSRLATFLFTA